MEVLHRSDVHFLGGKETSTREEGVTRSGSEVVTQTSDTPYEYSNHDRCGDVSRKWKTKVTAAIDGERICN